MFAKELISDDISPLLLSDTVELAINMMLEYKVKHLPIVDNNTFYGILYESSIADLKNTNIQINDCFHSFPKKYITESQHIFEVISEIANNSLTILPVVDEQMEYLGCIMPFGLIKALSQFSSINQPGGIIVLEMNVHDYSLGHIAQLVEENDTQILSSYIYSIPNSTLIELHLKLNRMNLNPVIQTLERFNYTVKIRIFEESNSDLDDRYESFMKYLSI